MFSHTPIIYHETRSKKIKTQVIKNYKYRIDALTDDKAVFVFVVSQHHSEWLESVSPTDRHGLDALDFSNLSGCEPLVRCPTHIAGNRLDLVMSAVADIVDVVVGTPLCTSDHCIVSSVVCVEQSVTEHNVRIRVFLKHRTSWDSVRGAVKSFAHPPLNFRCLLIHQLRSIELLVRSLV